MNTFKRKALFAAVLAALPAYFTLGNEPAPDDPDNPDPDAAPPVVDPPDDDLPDLNDSTLDDPPPDDPDVRLRAAEDARAKAEREAADARAALEARDRAAPPAPAQNDEAKRQWEEEERILKDPNSSAQDKYWVNANRTLRGNREMAAQALIQSRDINDRSDFDRLCAANPGLAKKYRDKTEQKLAEIRKAGGNMDRRLVMKMLIGDDIVEGRVKTAKKPAADANAGKTAGKVDRGAPISARSDVSRRAGNSERDKRRARLDGQLI